MAVASATDAGAKAREQGAEKLARLDGGTVFIFALMGLPGAALGLMLGTYMPAYFTGTLGVPLTAWAATLTLVRFIDMPFDPLVAMAMDRTRTPFGRYKTWYAIGLPILMAGVYLMFNAPVGVSAASLMLTLLVLYAGISITTLAHAAWAANLAVTYHDRSRVYGWIQCVAVVGSVGLSAAPLLSRIKSLPWLAAHPINPAAPESVPLIGNVVLVSLPAIALIVLLTVRERVLKSAAPRQQFSFSRLGATLRDMARALARPTMVRIIVADLCLVLGPGVTGPIYLFFFREAKGFHPAEVSLLLAPFIGAGLFGAPFWAWVARKLQKHRTVQIGAVAYAIAQTSLMLIPKAMFWPTFAGMFCVGFAGSGSVLLLRAMIADIADEVKLEQGKEQVSLLYSMVGITTKFGGSLNSIIIFPILAAFGFQASPHAHNTAHAIFGLELCYLFTPIIFVLIGASMFFGYKLDAKRHDEIRAQLEARDAEAASAAQKA